MTSPDGAGMSPPSESADRRLVNWWKRQSGLAQLAMVVGVVAVAWFAWHLYTGANTEQHERDLGGEVKTSLQHYLDADSDFAKYHLVVTDVTVIKADGNRYDGLATVHGAKSGDHKVVVHVTAGDSGGMWQTDNGAFLWVVGEQ